MNTALPVGLLALVSVAVSEIELPTGTLAVALVLMAVQFVSVTGLGAMKSFISALNESDERLFR